MSAPREEPGDGGTPSAVEVLVFGTVQGVGFRYRTRQRAEALGLGGSAANLPDGSVRVIAQGPRDRVAELVDWLRSAQAPGRVERAEVRERDVSTRLTGFDVG
ncbi:acylphosphatase [Arthrobacter sp. JSM 101049]|uniref:acylphosphatase n=1 Tax=Arthrobacter sp. JSM 101049 TaxID=929097 RepID=UPI00356AFF51